MQRIPVYILLIQLLGCAYETINPNYDKMISTDLKGNWNWKFSCGGSRGCVYASETDYRIMNITESSFEITDNGIVTFNQTYLIKDVIYEDNSKTYVIEFIDGAVWTVFFNDNMLTTGYNSVLYSVYERLG